jgi:hypothetical protein
LIRLEFLENIVKTRSSPVNAGDSDAVHTLRPNETRVTLSFPVADDACAGLSGARSLDAAGLRRVSQRRLLSNIVAPRDPGAGE